jgi:hypothetical protein
VTLWAGAVTESCNTVLLNIVTAATAAQDCEHTKPFGPCQLQTACWQVCSCHVTCASANTGCRYSQSVTSDLLGGRMLRNTGEQDTATQSPRCSHCTPVRVGPATRQIVHSVTASRDACSQVSPREMPALCRTQINELQQHSAWQCGKRCACCAPGAKHALVQMQVP